MRRKLTELAGPRLLARYPFVLSLNALLAVLLFTFVLRSARVDAQNNTPPARLGEIVSSMLSEAQFQTVYGSGWAIADGRDVSGTAYHALTGRTSVPDLRGVFLRGMNNGRAADKGNPAPTALGEYQADQFGLHGHSTTVMIGDNNVDGVDSTVTHSGEHHNETRSTGNAGGDETRPRNVSVNFFIRIDK